MDRSEGCERKKKTEAGDYEAECLTVEEEYVLWCDQYDWNQEELVMDEKWRADKEAGFREEDGEVEDEDRVEEKKQGRNNQMMGKERKHCNLRRIREEVKDKAMKEEEEEMEAKVTVDLNLEALK
jgi:hypothetical protein